MGKLLLAGDKSIPGMHLRQPAFIYSACESFWFKTRIDMKI